mmetsp:Transcript_6490/g.19701  ORF Transcript_6490/g.19701 Transcript_6490/m.19701 type:complete len:140 (-) Transcript_6490:89-508(-)|eukprot:CAMPEP_0198722850 /NCGR_PEP_ID=MMETSP1475-20131203/447_1 /TAXON_ID= ORGANISM="Unidentified sp., Strain CCMP1999" /NCGR_SAMPLE_ID=MMETSP1475 /ASSEMBLY_ACC=CAM_ASM_001111 /LENGTH=139 /DNA_ID=CAMNT_0044483775 /DNA_START=92 /DNA_END=511 /DNA_ORIENTATION=-
MKEYLEGKLLVEIPRGRDFPEKADPYLKVYMIKDATIGTKQSCMKKSGKEKNSSTPEWNLAFEKNLKGNYEGMKIRVMDSKLLHDKKFGDVDIDIDRLKSGIPIQGDYPLGDGKGMISLKVQFKEENVTFEYNTTSDSD